MEFAGQRLPVQHLMTVWHVGSFDPADKGCRGASQEGNGLSVSVNPEDWCAIAGLGGLPWWELTRGQGAFVDFHALAPQQHQELTTFALAAGWLERRPQWEFRYYDSEVDGLVTCLFATAQAAADEQAAMAPFNGYAKVREAIYACPTDKMANRLGFRPDPLEARDMALTFWVEDETQLDGVWWEDAYAPHELSAPRGVIVRRALPKWERRRLADPTGERRPAARNE